MFNLKIQHRMQFLPRAAVFGFVFKCTQLYRQLLCSCHSERFIGRMSLVFIFLLRSEALFSHFTRHNLGLVKGDLKSIIPGSWITKLLHFPPSLSSRDIPHHSSSKLPLHTLFVNTADFPASLRQGMFPPQNGLSGISFCREHRSGFLLFSLVMDLCAIWSFILPLCFST